MHLVPKFVEQNTQVRFTAISAGNEGTFVSRTLYEEVASTDSKSDEAFSGLLIFYKCEVFSGPNSVLILS